MSKNAPGMSRALCNTPFRMKDFSILK
jgi:hypothetical protein